MSKIQAGPAYCMLQKLVSEADSRFVAVHEEVSESSAISNYLKLLVNIFVMN